jgi:hypothetical protein
MAEESRSGKTTFEDLMLTLLALLLVMQMFEHGQKILYEKYGIELGAREHLVASAALTANTPLGTKVNMTQGGEYFSEPGATTAVGTFPPGTSLTLVGGPETVDGERWWEVESADGTRGWVPESALVQEGVGGIGPATTLGSNARALMDSGVWDVPGAGVAFAAMKMGEWGEIVKGPESKNGSRWWFFDRADSDDDGWVPEATLLLSTEEGWREGSPVVATQDVDLFERAGGGAVVGFLEDGNAATILGGPIEVGGRYWWLIETEDGTQGWVPEDALEDGGVKGALRSVLAVIVVIGALITVLLLGLIIYATIRTNQIRAREAQRIKAAIPKDVPEQHNERWEKVKEHVASENPNDWRLAIIEADIMLDELVTRMGYQGQTLGDRLKQATRGDIQSIDAAWEAHKVRNQIAHAGSDYILTQREAQRVIDLYASVFREFKYI